MLGDNQLQDHLMDHPAGALLQFGVTGVALATLVGH
jgi:hypothetical protein